MISKITANNSESYKKIFNIINNAIAEQKTKRIDADASFYNDIGEINSIESFFNNIEAIKRLWVNIKEDSQGNYISGDLGGYMLLMPADEDIFKIDANTREITIPTKVKKNGIGVYGDHFAEMIVLQIDRYFDGQDLLKTKCAINWNFTPSNEKLDPEKTKAEEAFIPNADVDPNYVTFGFIITKEMARQKGNLTFSVTFYTDEAGDINYSFNTLTATVAINDTLTLKNVNSIKNNIQNYLGRLTNSVYTDATISAVDIPTWKSGKKINDEYYGLDDTAYLENGNIKLEAYAVTNPNTADIYYRWVFHPIDGNISTDRNNETITMDTDYFEIDINNMSEEFNYYLKDSNDRISLLPMVFGSAASEHKITVTNPLTYSTVLNLLEAINAINNEEDEENITIPKFYVRGSSFEAASAGNYQVFAQGHIGSGAYEEAIISEERPIRAGINYYLKNNDNRIDVIHPLRNDDAISAHEEGKTLYVFVGGARNSEEKASNVCEIPAAKIPVVTLGVTSDYEFDNETVFKEDENSPYTYIDKTIAPTITAKVELIDSNDNRDYNGQFAIQLIEEDSPQITKLNSEDENEVTLESIRDNLYFDAYPTNGEFISVSNDEELERGKFLINNMSQGRYVVRAFNYCNGTYSVSANSNVMETSYVAPSLKNVSLYTLDDNGEQDQLVIENGEIPTGETELIKLELTASKPLYNFILDTSNIQNYTDAQASYFIEEVNSDGSPRTPEDKVKDWGDPEEDLRGEAEGEIVQDLENPNLYYFTIDRDIGFYRIKIENRYHGTLSVSHTAMFRIYR